ncbi:uncharacterized protein [Littorina saxatilis]
MYDQSIQHDQWHMDDQSFRSYDTANYDRENDWGYEAGGGGYRGGAVQRNRGRGQGQGQAVGQGQLRGRGRGQSLWGSQHPAGDQTSGGWGRGKSHERGQGGSFGLQDQGGGFGLQGQGGSFGLQCQGGSFGLQGQGGSFGLQGQGGSFGLQGQGDGFGQQGQGDGFGQQGQGQKNGVQGRGRGRGQSQSLNNNQSVGFQQMQRGRGRGCYSGGGGGNYSSDYYSSFGQQTAEEAIQNNNQLTNHGQPNQGANRYQNRGRVYVRGRSGGNQRGGGIEKKDIKERTVQAISDKIVVMVKEGGSGGRGKGGGRKERGTVKKPTSLMDLVDSASKRKLSHTKHLCLSPQATAFNEFLEFFRTSPDNANDIQTALKASHLSVKIEFEAEQLCFIIKPLFTGVLKVGGFFLTRGLGLSKKAVKHDCFERAVQILRNSSLEEILALEDCGKETLREEVEHQSKDDIEAFKTFLSQKQAGEAHTSQNVRTISDKQAGGIVTSRKVRTTQESKLQSVERNLPLADKMKMIQKEMKKSDLGKEDSAMVPRFDDLCSKVGIRVSALYKVVDLEDNRQYNTTPYKGRPDINLICEIYYDDVLVGQGQGHSRREAQIAAYNSIYNLLTKKNVSQIARGPKIPQQPEALHDFFEIVHKGARQGNNHHRMMSFGSYPPDVKKSMGDMVIIETVGDSIEDNAYKILEYSASRNSMLLEWKQLGTGNNLNGFRCEITVNGQKSVTGTGASKPKARNAAAAMILMDMYMSNDVISNKGVEDPSKAIPVEEITARAQALKLEGPPREERVQNVWPEEEEETDSEETTNPTLPEEEDLEAVKDSEEMADNTQFKEESDAEKDSEETANTIQPEEQSNTDRDSEKTANSNEDRVSQKQKWMSNPLQPWLEDAIVEMIESYAKRLTLEELIIGPGITPELRCFVTTAARHCLLGASLKDDPVRGSFLAVCQRSIPPEEMAMILRINKGASGRYKLVRDNKQISVLQRALFVRNFPDIWRARAKALFEADKVKKERASVSASPAATTLANSTLLTSLEQSAKAFFQAHKLREDEASVSDSFDATTSATSTSVPSSTSIMTSTENLDEENKLKKEEASACDSSAATTSTTSTRVPSSTITTTSTNNLDEADKLKEEEASDSDSSA